MSHRHLNREAEWQLRHSSCEAGEQSGAIRCGASGAKGGDQGKCEPAKHVPDAEPGKRVPTPPKRGRKRIAGNGHSFSHRRECSPLKKGLGSTAPEPFYVSRHLLDGQPSSRDHDPSDERGQAGEQQKLIQYSGGHDTLPCTAAPSSTPHASALPYLGKMVAAPMATALMMQIGQIKEALKAAEQAGAWHRSETTRCAISDRTQRSKIRAYSITSSASATKFSGNSMPVAFAVLRLMTSL
jgi:hypothetical protein